MQEVATVEPSTGAQKPPKGLEENIYTLNKFIVDTVYKFICIIYDGNDFARFYVLETVARVPYFAYLSVRFPCASLCASPVLPLCMIDGALLSRSKRRR